MPRGTTPLQGLPLASSRCSTVQHSSQFHHLTDLCTRISGRFAPPALIDPKKKHNPCHKASNTSLQITQNDCINTPVINSNGPNALSRESILLIMIYEQWKLIISNSSSVQPVERQYKAPKKRQYKVNGTELKRHFSASIPQYQTFKNVEVPNVSSSPVDLKCNGKSN